MLNKEQATLEESNMGVNLLFAHVTLSSMQNTFNTQSMKTWTKPENSMESVWGQCNCCLKDVKFPLNHVKFQQNLQEAALEFAKEEMENNMATCPNPHLDSKLEQNDKGKQFSLSETKNTQRKQKLRIPLLLFVPQHCCCDNPSDVGCIVLRTLPLSLLNCFIDTELFQLQC